MKNYKRKELFKLILILLAWFIMFYFFVRFSSGCDGFDPIQQSSSDTDWISISSGTAHTCGIHEDGTLECWGCEESYDFGQCIVPDGEYRAVAAGHSHTCAITVEDRVVCWGCDGKTFTEDNDKGQCTPPIYNTDAEEISVGFSHSSIVYYGDAVSWGCSTSNFGQCDNIE
tara:strand:+ start:2688 stop:3200 length:513 start_codon:yes stop_codon:yes gene_type:complete